ncbi:hypothetical protein, partial [Olivibacter oleidegradans]
ARADGTAVTCGRVGRCRSLQKAAVHCTAAFPVLMSIGPQTRNIGRFPFLQKPIPSFFFPL